MEFQTRSKPALTGTSRSPDIFGIYSDIFGGYTEVYGAYKEEYGSFFIRELRDEKLSKLNF